MCILMGKLVSRIAQIIHELLVYCVFLIISRYTAFMSYCLIKEF